MGGGRRSGAQAGGNSGSLTMGAAGRNDGGFKPVGTRQGRRKTASQSGVLETAGNKGRLGCGASRALGSGSMMASTSMNEGALDSNSTLAGACKGLGTRAGGIECGRGTAAGTCGKQTWTGNRGAAGAAGRTGEGRGAGAGAMATGGAWSSDGA